MNKSNSTTSDAVFSNAAVLDSILGSGDLDRLDLFDDASVYSDTLAAPTKSIRAKDVPDREKRERRIPWLGL